MSARRGSYLHAIGWIAYEDDTAWLYDEHGSPSVTLCLVADVFGRTIPEATADLRRAMAARERALAIADERAKAAA